ncbi:MAG: class I SAM-dependent methyltransferase [Chlamydiae bacterium]|nr:class I SAM-dependent methyltransferase [Chlamydiota bacterium]MBI3276220.1 class I SAM-dependent methyltransferase [Chlamydiota bacterium]
MKRVQKVVSKTAQILRHVAGILEEKASLHEMGVQRAITVYNMITAPDEDYYLQQYLHWIIPECERRYSGGAARFLDMGCGQGRLSFPLAKWAVKGKMIGVDFTSAVIQKARQYAQSLGIHNIEFVESDVHTYLKSARRHCYDIALMTEVSFILPSYKEVIAEVYRVLSPGGLFFISFRSQYFNLLYSVRRRDRQGMRLVRDQREGHWGDGSAWFSWQTSEDVRHLLSNVGFQIQGLYGVGVASGIEGDPLSVIAQPSKLTPQEQAHLMDLELSLAKQYVDCGRYILAIAEKTSEKNASRR